MNIKFIYLRDSNEMRTSYAKRDNPEVTIGTDTDDTNISLIRF